MIDESHQIPDDMAANYSRLINAAEDMRQAATDELKQVYADLRDELKGLGWNGASVSFEVAALKGAISEMRLAEKDKTKREVRGERIDDYVSLLTRARARESRPNSYSDAKGIDRDDRRRNRMSESMDDAVALSAQALADGLISEEGHRTTVIMANAVANKLGNGVITPSDEPHPSVSTVTPPPVTVKEEVSDGLLQNSPDIDDLPCGACAAGVYHEVAVLKGLEMFGHCETSEQAVAEAPRCKSDASHICFGARDWIAATDFPIDEASRADMLRDCGVEPQSEPSIAGGDHEVVQFHTAAEVVATVSAATTHKPLRPNCLRPGSEDCGGYGDKTCHACLVAARTSGEAA